MFSVIKNIFKTTPIEHVGPKLMDDAVVGDVSYGVVGKDDWAPLYVVCCRMLRPWASIDETNPKSADHWIYSGENILRDFIAKNYSIANRDHIFDTWMNNNATALRVLENEVIDKIRPKITEGMPHESALEYHSSRIAEIFLSSLHKLSPPVLDRTIVLADSTGVDYWEHPVIDAAREAELKAYGVTYNFVLSWLEVRGFNVDRMAGTVEIKGFSALKVPMDFDW